MNKRINQLTIKMEEKENRTEEKCGCGDNWWYLTPEQQGQKRERIAEALRGLPTQEELEQGYIQLEMNRQLEMEKLKIINKN